MNLFYDRGNTIEKGNWGIILRDEFQKWIWVLKMNLRNDDKFEKWIFEMLNMTLRHKFGTVLKNQLDLGIELKDGL